MKANSYNVVNSLPDFHPFINAAVRPSTEGGRPKGGMFIAVSKSIRKFVEDVSPNHWRLQAIKIKCNLSNILLINSYFPTDPKLGNFDETDLIETIQHIRSLLENVQHDYVIWAGDVNTDLSRSTRHTEIVKRFIDECQLRSTWEDFNIDFSHYQEINGVSYVSTIDHFFINESFNF